MGILNFNDVIQQMNKSPEEYIHNIEDEYKAKLKGLADLIINSDDRRDVLLISGPSSSGKTTTANLIKRYLKESGRDCIAMSTDDFFFDHDEMKSEMTAGFDFESPTIVNELLLLDKINELLLRGEAFIPHFNFIDGKKEYKHKKERLTRKGVIIVEGIHALNKDVIETGYMIDTKRVYVSVASDIYVDGTVISGRNLRLARRAVRDSNFRGHSIERTLDMWKSVCDGEDKYITPHIPNADFVIDTFLPYEPFVLKDSFIKLIGNCDKDIVSRQEVDNLVKLYNKCSSIEDVLIPKDSLLREFIGGGINE